ncbi:hypothetical protein I4U23_002275 [Adineta vaga]|nr:hypothetical protein I4U23_002275 [Adineta vaga]
MVTENKDNDTGITKDMKINADRFLMLCDNVQNCFALIDNSMFELLEMKDQFLLENLPRKILVRITLVVSRFYRAYTQSQLPIYELIHLIQLQNNSFNQKCILFKRLYNSHEMKKRMLNIALQKIASIEKDIQQYREENSMNNWQKMYIRLALPRSNVRKWKFRLQTFREKAILGYEHVIEWFHTTASRSSSPLSEILCLEESIDEQDPDQLGNSDGRASSVQEIEEQIPQTNHDSDHSEVIISDNEGNLHRSAGTYKSEQIQPPSPIFMIDNEVQVQPDFEDQQTSTEDKFSTKSIIMRIYRPIGIVRTTFQCIVHAYGQTYTTKEWKLNKTNSLLDNNVKKKSRFINSTFEENKDIDKQQNDEILISMSNICSRIKKDIASNNIRIDVFGDKKLFGFVKLTSEDLQIFDLPVLNSQISSPLIDMNSNISKKSIRFDLDQTSSELYYTYLSHTPQIFTIYDDKHEPMGELPLLMFWYNKFGNMQATKSTMTVPVVENEARQTTEVKYSKPISNTRIETVKIAYENEIIQIHESYQAEIQRLTELLHNKLSRQSSQMIDSAEVDEKILETHQEGVSNIYIRRQLPRHKMSGKQYHHVQTSRQNSLDNFLDRNQIYSRQRSIHRHQLISKVSRETSSINERQMEIQHRLYKSQEKNAFDDLCLPGVFMPLHSNHVYNPRAYQYFHSIGTRNPRLTQPPSIFKFPAVPSGSLSVLNLFELTRSQKMNDGTEPPPNQ